MEEIELLAPVGSMESLYAAIANGANAVYLGGKSFSARKHAVNFDDEELIEAVKLAHKNDVEIHVAVNILLSDDEVKEALDYIRFLYEINVDAIIVQDMGLASMVLELFPDLPVHASTQMTINNLEGARYLEKLGFARVVLARETPLEEIRRICENTNLEVEVFVHGALCVAYSGQCLMSSLIGGRSGNRGNCAQPCRMAYSIVDRDGKILDGWEDRYVLSTRDLNVLENIDELIDIGVSSFKIEGRMKRPEYVATIVSKYRKAIDEGVDKIDDEDQKDIRQIFNRSFTKGMSFEDFGNDYISYERPDNRGVLLGKVIDVDDKTIKVVLEEELAEKDGIEFTLENGSYKGMASKISGGIGQVIKLPRIGNVKLGSKVYKTSSVELLERARKSYEERDGNKFPLYLKLTIEKGEKPRLVGMYGKYIVGVNDDFIVEESQNIALDYDSAFEQISKLGDTDFYIEKFDADIEEDSFVPVRVLNKLRRDLTSQLEEKLVDIDKREALVDYDLKKSVLLNINKRENLQDNKISVRLSDFRQIENLDTSKIDRLYLGFTRNIDRVLEVLDSSIEVYLWTDRILYERDFKELDDIIEKYQDRIHGISVSNMGTLNYVAENYNLKIHGDIGLNIFNSYTANHFYNSGLSSITLSPEVTARQIREIKNRVGGEVEIISYGYLPSMIMETCPMALIKGCKDDDDCQACQYSKGYGLRDRMNMIFPLERTNSTTTLYNSVVLMVLEDLKDIIGDEKYLVRLDFTIERNNIDEILYYYNGYLKNEVEKFEVANFIERFRSQNEITKGHFYRGII